MSAEQRVFAKVCKNCNNVCMYGPITIQILQSGIHLIGLYHAAAILHKNKTLCTASLAVKNLRTGLDVQKQSFLFSGDSRWPHARDKGF